MSQSKRQNQETIYAIGHSTRDIDAFIELLERNGIDLLVDIRTVPGSRKNPQFGKDNLSKSLAERGIDYLHEPKLGGLRKVKKDSINIGWRNDSFRGYADYMLTDDFHQALDELVKLGAHKSVAIMCAEAVPWRCHRNLVSDALSVSGVEVKHIISESEPKEHKLCSFAHVEGHQLIYR
jgi:uncharacterized protein (DUF488 family)